MTYKELTKKLKSAKRVKGNEQLQVKILNRTTDLQQSDSVDDLLIVSEGSGSSNGIYIYVDGVKS